MKKRARKKRSEKEDGERGRRGIKLNHIPFHEAGEIPYMWLFMVTGFVPSVSTTAI